MKWILKIILHKRFYKFTAVVLASLFCMLSVSLRPIDAFSSRPDEKRESHPSASSPATRTVVVGLPKEHEVAFMQDMERSRKKFDLVNQAEEEYRTGDYETALTLLGEAMKYANPNNLTSLNIHWQLADIYEAMGKKEEFLREIDWLISKSRNPKTTQKFIDRKEKFLAQYGK